MKGFLTWMSRHGGEDTIMLGRDKLVENGLPGSLGILSTCAEDGFSQKDFFPIFFPAEASLLLASYR